MARIYTKDLLLDQGALGTAMSDLNSQYNTKAQNQMNKWNTLGQLFGNLGQIGADTYLKTAEYNAEQDEKKKRLEMAQQFMDKYKDDPMAQGVAYDFVKTGSPSSMQAYENNLSNKAASALGDKRTVATLVGKIKAAQDQLAAYGDNPDYKDQNAAAKRQLEENLSLIRTYPGYENYGVETEANANANIEVPEQNTGLDSKTFGNILARYSGYVDVPKGTDKFITEEERADLLAQIENSGWSDAAKYEAINKVNDLPTAEQNTKHFDAISEKKQQDANKEFWQGKARDEAAKKKEEEEEDQKKLTAALAKLTSEGKVKSGENLGREGREILQKYGYKRIDGAWKKEK